jgi:hypothetical protein
MAEAANNLNDWWYDPVAIFECTFCSVYKVNDTFYKS